MSSKLGMSACREYRHWSPVGVVSGIGDELIIERQRAPFVDVIGIISLKNFLCAVVQLAITDQQTDAARGEEVTMRAGFGRKRPGLMKWLTPTLQRCPSIRPYELCARDSGQVVIREQWSSPIDFLLLSDYAGRGGIRNRLMFQRHCSQYAGAVMLLYLCLRYVSLLDRVTPV